MAIPMRENNPETTPNVNVNENVNEIAREPREPAREEVREFFEKNNFDNWELFFETYNAVGWIDAKGEPVKNWRALARKWSACKAHPADERQKRQLDIASYVARNIGNNAGLPGCEEPDMPF